MDNLRNRLWREIKEAKSNWYCLVIYTNKVRKQNRYTDIAVIVSAVVVPIFFNYIPKLSIAASVITLILTIFKSLLPMIKHPDDSIVFR